MEEEALACGVRIRIQSSSLMATGLALGTHVLLGWHLCFLDVKDASLREVLSVMKQIFSSRLLRNC